MAKTLKQILEVYAPKSKDEKKFMDKHIVAKSKLDDRGTQDDKLFNATNIKTVSRETEHGYNPGNDEKVYEEMSKVHPMALHVKDVGKGKFKVHAVGKHLADGIKVGEHLSDSELDDATEMGAKIKMIEEGKKESRKEFVERQKRLAAASNETAKDPERLKRLSQLPGYTAAMDLAKKTTQEEVEDIIEEAEQLTEDEELTQLLNTIYGNLSDENKEIFEHILEEDPDQMIEFLEQLELQDGK